MSAVFSAFGSAFESIRGSRWRERIRLSHVQATKFADGGRMMRKFVVGAVLGAGLWLTMGDPAPAQDRPLTADDVAALLGAGTAPAEADNW